MKLFIASLLAVAACLAPGPWQASHCSPANGVRLSARLACLVLKIGKIGYGHCLGVAHEAGVGAFFAVFRPLAGGRRLGGGGTLGSCDNAEREARQHEQHGRQGFPDRHRCRVFTMIPDDSPCTPHWYAVHCLDVQRPCRRHGKKCNFRSTRRVDLRLRSREVPAIEGDPACELSPPRCRGTTSTPLRLARFSGCPQHRSPTAPVVVVVPRIPFAVGGAQMPVSWYDVPIWQAVQLFSFPGKTTVLKSFSAAEAIDRDSFLAEPAIARLARVDAVDHGLEVDRLFQLAIDAAGEDAREVGRRPASVAFGLWQTTHTPGSSVRLLPCRLSTSWHTLHLAMSTTDRRATGVPVIAKSLKTLLTASRSVNVPGVVTSPAGCPSIVTRNVPVCVAGIATGGGDGVSTGRASRYRSSPKRRC